MHVSLIFLRPAALFSPPSTVFEREAKREASRVPLSAAGRTVGSLSLRLSPRRRERGGTGDLQVRCVDSRSWSSGGGVLVAAASLFWNKVPAALLHLGGVFGGGVDELIRLLVPLGVPGEAVVLSTLWAWSSGSVLAAMVCSSDAIGELWRFCTGAVLVLPGVLVFQYWGWRFEVWRACASSSTTSSASGR